MAGNTNSTDLEGEGEVEFVRRRGVRRVGVSLGLEDQLRHRVVVRRGQLLLINYEAAQTFTPR